MKTRIIQTRFWDDKFIDEANYITRYVYIYLLTNQYINISGIFQLTINKILFETGITKQQFLIAEKELKENKKVLFIDGWVYVSNARKNNQYEKSPFNVISCENEINKIPIEIMNKIQLYQNSSIDSSIGVLSIVPKNNKQETISNKYIKIEDCKEEDFQEIADKYKVPIDFVHFQYDKMYTWKESNPNNPKTKNRNWKITLMTFVRDNMLSIKTKQYERGSKIAVVTTDEN